MNNYDVVVVGSGSGGQTAAYTMCEYGLKVALVENSPTPGGVCALAGCQAKKYFYEATETVARSRHLAGKGIAHPAEADWAAVLAQKNAFTDPIPAGTRKGLQGSGIDFIDGTAAFEDQETLVAGGQTLKARFFILATGATPCRCRFRAPTSLRPAPLFWHALRCRPGWYSWGAGSSHSSLPILPPGWGRPQGPRFLKWPRVHWGRSTARW